jgi:hypothetical protein
MVESLAARDYYPILSADKDKIVRALADLARCGEVHSIYFDVVKNKFFQEFVRLINPGVTLPPVRDLIECW